MARWLAAIAAWGMAVGPGSCLAAEYTFDVPEALGSPPGELNLTVNLGGEFANITGARLRIAGTHAPGLLGDLNSTATFPYPASIDAYSPAEPFGHSGILGALLPSVAGPFEVDKSFLRISPGGPPDFSSWLDGTANFYFSAGPSFYPAIYRTVANPVVAIASATLTVTGERANSATTPAADFNGDGTVDGDDLGMWQAAFGSQSLIIFPGADADGDSDADGADFLVWQQHLGLPNSNAVAAAVPEPAAAAALLSGTWATVIRRRAGRC